MIRQAQTARSVRVVQLQRLMSTASAAATCPVTGTATEKATESHHPTLRHIRKLPLVGSSISAFSGIPPMDETTAFSFWPKLNQEYGDFYSIGIPGLGKGMFQEIHVLHDPQEYMKIVRREGKYPSSVVELQWALRDMLENESAGRAVSIFNSGEDWKTVRMFLQTDLFSPQSAAKYVPNIQRAAEISSPSAPQYQDDIKTFLDRAAFDMFSMVMMGQMTGITDKTNASADPEDTEFADNVGISLMLNHKVMKSVSTALKAKLFGYQDGLLKEMNESWSNAMAHGRNKIDLFCERRERGELTEEENASYLNQALERQRDQEELSVEDVKGLCMAFLGASVDTTSGYVTWPLLHTVLNPEIQNRIREELKNNVADGKITPESIRPSNAPYLHATFREAHRLNSTSPLTAFKYIPEEIEVHGQTFPAGTAFAFDGFSKGMQLVEDPTTFNPDRWLPDAVEARKGTPAAILDHPLFSGPFSQGARRCPGSRVAKNEALALLAQLVYDWDMSTTDVTSYEEVPYYLATLTVPEMPKIQFEAVQK